MPNKKDLGSKKTPFAYYSIEVLNSPGQRKNPSDYKDSKYCEIGEDAAGVLYTPQLLYFWTLVSG